MKPILNFTKNNGIIPAVVQDYKTKQIYMLGYINQQSLQKMIETGWVHFWSRTRKKLWMKGEQSGNKLKIKNMYTDCDNDTILIKVELIGSNVCHTGNKSCFYTKLEKIYDIRRSL